MQLSMKPFPAPATDRGDRRGVAATEFAVCLPVLLLLVLGMIETCSMIFVKQSLAIAAYEGAHVGIKANATVGEIRTTCEAILRDRRVQGATITVTPNNLNAIPVGDYIEVRVTAPSDRNGVLPVRFFRGRTLDASAVVMKEI